ncbi:MAG: formate/nitrite transporter family protein [Deltaproteobacteria bacterium]|nr:formate/nitrite transporter family protein [Deltaproteobacteria bacterium]
MDNVTPADLVEATVAAAAKKAHLGVTDMVLRGTMSGAILGIATSLVFVVLAQGLPAIVGALLFPVGFVILVLLGLELVTGNFALMPQAVAAGRISIVELGRSWLWVYVGNLIGSLGYAVLFWFAVTYAGHDDGGQLAEVTRAIATKKTIAYVHHGAPGWTASLVKAVLCNWMVTIGTVLAFVSRSTVGKITAMWLPITIFFAHGYEHSVVNMFVIPTGMLMGADISVSDWWLWNQIPVTVGNIIGGGVFTGLALWFTHGRSARATIPTPAHDVAGVATDVPRLADVRSA